MGTRICIGIFLAGLRISVDFIYCHQGFVKYFELFETGGDLFKESGQSLPHMGAEPCTPPPAWGFPECTCTLRLCHRQDTAAPVLAGGPCPLTQPLHLLPILACVMPTCWL